MAIPSVELICFASTGMTTEKLFKGCVLVYKNKYKTSNKGIKGELDFSCYSAEKGSTHCSHGLSLCYCLQGSHQ